MRSAIPAVTGDAAPAARKARGAAIETLRRAYLGRKGSIQLRTAAAMALARSAGDEDARLLARVVDRQDEPAEVVTASALALGFFRELAPETDATVHAALLRATDPKHVAAPFAWIALGARGEAPPMAELGRPDPDRALLPEVFFAAGRLHAELILPELRTAARKARYFSIALKDGERGHAARALADFALDDDIRVLAQVASSRRAGFQARRGAAFGLFLMAGEGHPEARARLLQQANAALFERTSDEYVRWFGAMALGRQGTNPGVIRLMNAYDETRDTRLRSVLALAIAAGARERPGWDQLRTFLVREAERARDAELRVALETAIGLARADKGTRILLASLADPKASAGRRSWAAEALGNVEDRSPEVRKELWAAFNATLDGPLAESSAVALGLLGDRTVIEPLGKRVDVTRDTARRARLAYILGVLGGPRAIAKLAGIVATPGASPTLRGMAAVGLGLALDERPVDPLAALKGRIDYLNPTPPLYYLLRGE